MSLIFHGTCVIHSSSTLIEWIALSSCHGDNEYMTDRVYLWYSYLHCQIVNVTIEIVSKQELSFLS